MKSIKLYIDENYIKERLGEEYKDCNVIFANSNIDRDNTLNFECLVTEENIPDRNNIRREML